MINKTTQPRLFEIKNKCNGEIIFSGKFLSFRLCVEQATKTDADLRYADLRYANLRDADLRYANLRDADLYGANLYGANLHGATLYGASLRDADLRYANLRYADLRYADLRYANLRDADLRYANLRDADLRYAKIEDKQIEKLTFQICPEQGSFRAWKKLSNGHVALIEIPTKASRTSNLIGRKCRAEYVKTLKIYDKNGGTVDEKVCGKYDHTVTYQQGKITKADKWNSDPRLDCTNGIHFFITQKEAREW